MRMAKQQYYNELAAGAFSNYDEKVLEEMTLYGLPMLRINMPVTTTASIWGKSALETATVQRVEGSSSGLTATPLSFNFSFTENTENPLGSYFTITGEDGVHVVGGRPFSRVRA